MSSLADSLLGLAMFLFLFFLGFVFFLIRNKKGEKGSSIGVSFDNSGPETGGNINDPANFWTSNPENINTDL